MKLVIVESPAKAQTIEKFLGSEYEVLASYGHVRDLPGSAAEIPAKLKDQPWARLAVDVDNNFAPIYIVPSDSKKQITALKKRLKEADSVILATDEDREGESISWHLLEVLKPKVPVERIVFHEITKEAIDEAVANPRQVDNELVRAQESRRILDRLFGYSLSPVLWKKVRPKLSAGRVQSVALRLLVEREEERRNFDSTTYWDVEAALSRDNKPFTASLLEVGGQRLAQSRDFDTTTGAIKNSKALLLDEAGATKIKEDLLAGTPWQVRKVEQKETKQRPQPPFITSTLQQAASSLLGFSPRDTMRLAQRLYEGVDLGGGEREGLITYMRTESVTLSGRALEEAGHVIKDLYGDRYYQGARPYKTKSRMAQEAHEAIRPTHLSRKPEQVAAYLEPRELKLYRLIWNRTLASQMADAIVHKTSVDFTANCDPGEALLRANGSVVTFPGFLRVADSSQKDTELPAIEEGMQVGPGEAIALEGANTLSHETKPPARFTEATLVKRLEEEGIGRPSTYAPTLSIIQQRGYAELMGKVLIPSYVGIAVVRLLRQHFAEYVDLQFTAKMEDVLDEIAQGKQDWTTFLQGFYRGHSQYGHGLEPQIEQQLEHIEFPAIPVGEDNGQPVIVRLGRNAPFIQRGEGGEGNTASVPNDIPYGDLSLGTALALIEARAKGNEPLGKDPETGENVYALVGPFGPYVQRGEMGEDGKKPKRTGLPKGTPIDAVTLDVALQYLALPRKLGMHPEGNSVRAAVGRFGPYVVHNKEFRSVVGDDDVLTITLERALELLAQPKGRGRQKTLLATVGKIPDTETTLEVYDGRYGPYVTDGTLNASLPKGMAPEEVTVEKALPLLEKAAERKRTKGPVKKKAAAKRKAKAKPKAKAKAKKKS